MAVEYREFVEIAVSKRRDGTLSYSGPLSTT